jgi:hypothetical protein
MNETNNLDEIASGVFSYLRERVRTGALCDSAY